MHDYPEKELDSQQTRIAKFCFQMREENCCLPAVMQNQETNPIVNRIDSHKVSPVLDDFMGASGSSLIRPDDE